MPKTPKHLKYTTVKFVIAPGIPTSELDALEAAWKEDKLLALNYSVYVKMLGFYSATSKPLITAPGIPLAEAIALRKRVKKAIKHPKGWGTVFTNYDVNVQVI